MECGETQDSANSTHGTAASHNPSEPVGYASPAAPPPPDSSADSKREDKAKRTKVHKREQELFGLVTPIFLPLLDASDSKEKERKKRHKKEEVDSSSSQSDSLSSARHAEHLERTEASPSKSSEQMDVEYTEKTPQKESRKEQEPMKKMKRPAIKKSSLRSSGEKRRRKRVSLVIDGQTVLPADQILEPQLMSPSETTESSASNSIASLEDLLDPRLMDNGEPVQTHQDPVHHSLYTSDVSDISPTNTSHPLNLNELRSQAPIYQSPPTHLEYQSPPSHLEFEPPQTQTQTYLDPSPPNADIEIPQHASDAPIYASEPEQANAEEEEFSTYVGGIHGSGVDDVDQTGSLGYPSSLGASYMESYMASRPLSVRMAAAEKAGLNAEERRRLLNREESKKEDKEHKREARRAHDADDGMDIMGEMEDF